MSFSFVFHLFCFISFHYSFVTKPDLTNNPVAVAVANDIGNGTNSVSIESDEEAVDDVQPQKPDESVVNVAVEKDVGLGEESYDREVEEAYKNKQQQLQLQENEAVIQIEFEKYTSNEKPYDKKLRILEYWRRKKRVYPRLYKLALIIFAVPTTQCSVERLFSAMKYILSDVRSSLGSTKLEDILLLRTNSELWAVNLSNKKK